MTIFIFALITASILLTLILSIKYKKKIDLFISFFLLVFSITIPLVLKAYFLRLNNK